MKAMKSPGIRHVTTVGSDSGATRRFYVELLGMTEHGDATQGADDRDVLTFGGASAEPGTLMRVSIVPEAPRGRWGIGGLHHVAFGVDDEAALLRWKRRLTDAGVHVTGPYDRGYFTSLYFVDPGGQILEIATTGPGYTIDEPVDRLGERLLHPPRNIVRGYRDEGAIAALTHAEPVPEITEAMALRGVHHVSGITDDIDGAGSFYGSLVGLDLIKRTTNRDDPSQLHYFWAAREGAEILPHSAYTLFGWPGSWKRARPGIGQTESVTFRSGEHTLEAWASALDAAGVATRQLDDRTLRFAAPDGMQLEIGLDALSPPEQAAPAASSVEGAPRR